MTASLSKWRSVWRIIAYSFIVLGFVILSIFVVIVLVIPKTWIVFSGLPILALGLALVGSMIEITRLEFELSKK